MKIREDTTQYFIQDKETVLNYLKSRNLDNSTLTKVIEQYPFGLLSNADFTVENEIYSISHFLSKSDIVGYDIKCVNDNLGLSNSCSVAFALVLGDDVLCYDTLTKEVYIWLIQTDDGKKIVIKDSLSDFLNEIINE